MRRHHAAALLGAAAMALVCAGGLLNQAEAAQQNTCSGNGTLYTSGSAGNYLWQVQGSGTCNPNPGPSNPRPVETERFFGKGTSATLGLCSNSPAVTNLTLNVTVAVKDVVTKVVTKLKQTWSAQSTTFPVMTPFNVTSSDGSSGGGVVFHNIFFDCGNSGGEPSASFYWTTFG